MNSRTAQVMAVLRSAAQPETAQRLGLTALALGSGAVCFVLYKESVGFYIAELLGLDLGSYTAPAAALITFVIIYSFLFGTVNEGIRSFTWANIIAPNKRSVLQILLAALALAASFALNIKGGEISAIKIVEREAEIVPKNYLDHIAAKEAHYDALIRQEQARMDALLKKNLNYLNHASVTSAIEGTRQNLSAYESNKQREIDALRKAQADEQARADEGNKQIRERNAARNADTKRSGRWSGILAEILLLLSTAAMRVLYPARYSSPIFVTNGDALSEADGRTDKRTDGRTEADMFKNQAYKSETFYTGTTERAAQNMRKHLQELYANGVRDIPFTVIAKDYGLYLPSGLPNKQLVSRYWRQILANDGEGTPIRAAPQ